MAAVAIADPYGRIAELEGLLRQAEEEKQRFIDSIEVATAVCFAEGFKRGFNKASGLTEDAALSAVTS